MAPLIQLLATLLPLKITHAYLCVPPCSHSELHMHNMLSEMSTLCTEFIWYYKVDTIYLKKPFQGLRRTWDVAQSGKCFEAHQNL